MSVRIRGSDEAWVAAFPVALPRACRSPFACEGGHSLAPIEAHFYHCPGSRPAACQLLFT